MDPIKTYDYLCRARGRVMGAVRPLTAEQYGRGFGFGLGSIGSTLTHIMISEWYYIERLLGRSVAPYEEWPIKYERPPALGVVESAWREQERVTRGAIAGERDWGRTITYESLAGEDGRRYLVTATAGEFFVQLALHEVHHRAQVMAMLRGLGGGARPVQDIDYNDLMFERREMV